MDRWRDVDRIFQAALSRPAAERSQVLSELCSGDDGLRREVESLLDDAALSASVTRTVAARTGQRLDHYEILNALGRGGMGEVYRARDIRLGRDVAIKFLPETVAADAPARSRLLREARLAAVLDHPNICTIFEVGDSSGCPYIAMQYIEGETLSARLKRGRVSAAEALHLSTQIAAALGAAHERGLVHRDIKPLNVMVTPTDGVKVLDFGLAKQSAAVSPDLPTATEVSVQGTIAGTIAYMSPEQLRGEELDARSDVFSFGTLLHEMLTGEHPFAGPTSTDTIAAILAREPKKMSDSSRFHLLAVVTRRCLEKDKALRYSTAGEIAAHLATISAALAPASRAPADMQLPTPPLLDGLSRVAKLVGRDSDLRSMTTVWDACIAQRERRLILLCGEPGIGKSSLCATFARQRAADNAAVLIGRSDEQALVSYQPFIEALGWYIRSCPEDALHAHLAAIGGGAELVPLLPELGRRVPGLPGLEPMSAEGQRFRLFEAVKALLLSIAATTPTLLLLDDLHWADQATLLMLRHVIRAQEAAPLCIVINYRESELALRRPVADVVADLGRQPQATRIALHGLAAPDVDTLVAQVAGSEASRGFVDEVGRRSGGNPFFIGEMVRHLLDTGGVAAKSVSIPDSVHDVIQQRVSRLDEDAARVLAVASVIGHTFELTLLERISGLAEDRFLEVIEQAIRAQLISEVRGASNRGQFVHALIRETLYGGLSEARRTRLHRRIAEAVEQQPASQLPLADLAHHFSLAAATGVADKAYDYAIRAGEQATAAFAYEEANRFYDMALQALEFRPADTDTLRQRGDLHYKRARAFQDLNQWALQKREAGRALADTPAESVERRAELSAILTEAAFYLLDIPGTRGMADSTLELAEQSKRPDLAAEAMGWIARCRQSQGDLNVAIELDRQAVALAGTSPRALRSHSGLSVYLAGRFDEIADKSEAIGAEARASRDSAGMMWGLPHLALCLASIGRYGEALQAFEEARAFGRRYGVMPPLARATAMLAGVRLSLFDYEASAQLAHEAREIARSVNFNPPVVSAGIDLMLTGARTGRLDGISELAAETTALSEALAGWHGWLWGLRLYQARAEIALRRGDLETCLKETTTAIDMGRVRGRPKYLALGLATRAQALERLNRTTEARTDAREAADVSRRIKDPALTLVTLDTLIALDGTEELGFEAQSTVERIRNAIPDPGLRNTFLESETVRRVLAR